MSHSIAKGCYKPLPRQQVVSNLVAGAGSEPYVEVRLG
jgi:hypothetical protein